MAGQSGEMAGRRIANRVRFYLLVAGILLQVLFPVCLTLIISFANDQTQSGTHDLLQSLDPANYLQLLRQRGFLLALGKFLIRCLFEFHDVAQRVVSRPLAGLVLAFQRRIVWRLTMGRRG